MPYKDAYAESGGDWLLEKDRGDPVTFGVPTSPSAPAPSPGLPSQPAAGGSGVLGTIGGGISGVLGKTLSGVNSAVGGALATLTGGPGAALAGAIPSLSTSVSSSSGDSSSGLNQSFNYNAAFQVGGSGKQTQNAGISAGSNLPLYLAIAGIALIVAARAFRSRK